MKRTINILYWTPRMLALVFIIFVSLFSIDVFEAGKTIGYYLVALSMHLITNFILVGILAIAWKYEKLGGTLFILLALSSVIFFHTYQQLISFLIISFPIFLIGLLFLYRNSQKEKR